MGMQFNNGEKGILESPEVLRMVGILVFTTE